MKRSLAFVILYIVHDTLYPLIDQFFESCDEGGGGTRQKDAHSVDDFVLQGGTAPAG